MIVAAISCMSLAIKSQWTGLGLLGVVLVLELVPSITPDFPETRLGSRNEIRVCALQFLIFSANYSDCPRNLQIRANQHKLSTNSELCL